MSLPYIWRLSFLCCSAFFLIHALAGLVLRMFTPAAVRWACQMSSRGAARFLFAMRMLPVGIATVFVAGLCVPSYLEFEPGATREEVGFIFVFAALLGISIAVYGIVSAVGASVATFRFVRDCRKSGHEIRLPFETAPVLVIEGKEPILAIAGSIRQRIIVSRGVLNALSNEQLEAAILHETAHRKCADNLKRLFLLLAPPILPLSQMFRGLEHAWVKFSEFAADDRAVGDSAQRSLTLASALVRVARMGTSRRLSPLCTALVSNHSDCSQEELYLRVDRLLRPSPVPRGSRRKVQVVSWVAAMVTAVFAASLLFLPSTLHFVHDLLERLTH